MAVNKANESALKKDLEDVSEANKFSDEEDMFQGIVRS